MLSRSWQSCFYRLLKLGYTAFVLSNRVRNDFEELHLVTKSLLNAKWGALSA